MDKHHIQRVILGFQILTSEYTHAFMTSRCLNKGIMIGLEIKIKINIDLNINITIYLLKKLRLRLSTSPSVQAIHEQTDYIKRYLRGHSLAIIQNEKNEKSGYVCQHLQPSIHTCLTEENRIRTLIIQ